VCIAPLISSPSRHTRVHPPRPGLSCPAASVAITNTPGGGRLHKLPNSRPGKRIFSADAWKCAQVLSWRAGEESDRAIRGQRSPSPLPRLSARGVVKRVRPVTGGWWLPECCCAHTGHSQVRAKPVQGDRLQLALPSS
jgi:hypothetical protein